jgi:hypothetical protein
MGVGCGPSARELQLQSQVADLQKKVTEDANEIRDRDARLATPGASPQTPTAPSATAPATPLVTIDSTRPFTVVERNANNVAGWSLTLPVPAYISTSQWEPVCVAPCQLHLDPNAVYRVGGGGVAPSSAFTLPRGSDSLRLHVHAGSSLLHDGGIVLTVAGAVSVIAGVAVVGASTVETDPRAALQAGVAFFVPGLAAVLAGAVLWLTNGSSVVTEDGRSP